MASWHLLSKDRPAAGQQSARQASRPAASRAASRPATFHKEKWPISLYQVCWPPPGRPTGTVGPAGPAGKVLADAKVLEIHHRRYTLHNEVFKNN
jgi:hypothetical protein